MTYKSPGAKANREKAQALLPGQRKLDGSPAHVPTLGFKIPANPHTIFLGLGPGPTSAEKGHYYPGATTQFWNFLYESGLWPELLTYERDAEILKGGFGLADVTRRATKGAVHATKAAYFQARSAVKQIVATHRPRLLAFVGKEAYAIFVRRPTSDVSYGEQPPYEGVGIFVLPTPSNRYQQMSRKDKLAWYRQLATRVEALRQSL